jgi:peptide/nickel transport system substrate-binding protein
MSWKLKFWSKKPSSSLHFSPVLQKKLDHKLIIATQGRKIPTPRQLKYVGRFLTFKEKKILLVLSSITVLTAVLWGVIFLSTHLQRVPTIGGNYREALLGEPKYLNPLFASANDVDADISRLIYSGLFRYTETGDIAPDLAESYKVSADGKTYDITLKNNIHWSDGVDLKIDDVVYTFELLQNQEVNSPLYTSFQGVTVKKTSENTLRFTLKKPFAPFIHTLTVGIIPEHIWQNQKLDTLRLAKANLQPIGTGPWKFDKLIKGSDGSIQEYILTRNENYYDQKPYFKTVTFTFFPDITLAISKLHSQDIDALAFPPRSENDLLNTRNVINYPVELPQYTALFFNLQDALMKDKDLRAALRLGTNKEMLLKQILDGNGVLVDSPLLTNFITTSSAVLANPDAANALLDKKWSHIQPEEYLKIRKDQQLTEYQHQIEADLKDSSTSTTSTPSLTKEELAAADQQITEAVKKEMSPQQSFYRKDKNNQLLVVTITALDTPEQQKIANAIARQWQNLGIFTTIERVSAEQMSRQVLRNHDSYQIVLYGELVGADPDPYPLWHSSQISYPGLNITQFSNRTADKLLEDARATLDPALRSESYKKFQTILNDEIPAIFLYSPRYQYIINKDIKGVRVLKLIQPSDRFATLSEWYSKTKLVWK